MTYALEIRHQAPAAGAVEVWAEHLAEPVVPLRPARPRRSRPALILQDLQWMRERLMFAFIAPGDYRDDRPADKPLGAFDTSRTREAFPVWRAQDLAECPAEGGKARPLPVDYVARLARDTTRVTFSETRKKKTSSHPLAPTAFEDARLVRIVAALEPGHRHWLRYAYADSVEWQDEAGAVCELWARVAPSFGKLQAKTLKRLQGLAHLAVQHGKREANSGTELYSASRLAVLLGVKEANYDQHWRPRWVALLDALDRLDQEALRVVLKQFNEK